MTEGEGSGAFANSLTDLMTSLMVIFILLLVATLNNRARQTQDVRSRLITELQKVLRGAGPNPADLVEVKKDPQDPLGVVVVMPRELSGFAFGSAELPAGAAAALGELVPKIVGVACGDLRDQIGSVTVEGHTDPTGSDLVNLKLSQNRATAVVVASLGSLPELSTQRTCFERLLSVSGRGKGETLGKQISMAEMPGERRVQFKLRVKSDEERTAKSGLGGI